MQLTQEINARVQALGFENTKVCVSNVDSQSSAAGGIVIQVLGEMSTRNGPWRKFAQTFFLAEQPNGYYVLNDIFRYLKDEGADEAATQPAAKAADEKAEQPAAQPQPEPAEAKPAEAKAEAKAEPAPAKPAAEQPAAAPAAERVPQPAEAKQESAPAPAPGPKTWANLAATGAGKWGTTASDSRGVSEAGKSASAPAAPAGAAQAPAAASAQRRPGTPANTTQVFVKNVSSAHVSLEALRAALETFGPLKDVQVNAAKEFAFAEFASADAARRAIGTSQVPVGEWHVTVEKRRPAERGGGGGRGRGGGGRGTAGRGRGAAH